jgi:hypothetical protein
MSSGLEIKERKYEKSKMSSNPPPKTPQPTSKTSSTPPEKPLDPALVMEVLNKTSAELDARRQESAEATALIKKLSEELNERRGEMASIGDFHKALEGAKQDDLRMYWDVRIVRGEDTPFASVHGVSTLPGLLSGKMKGHAPSMIQQEVADKIAQPLTAVFMTEGETQNFIFAKDTKALEYHENGVSPVSYEPVGGGDAVVRISEEMSHDEAPPGEEAEDEA